MKKIIFVAFVILIVAFAAIYYLSVTSMICWKILGCDILVRQEEEDISGKIVVLVSLDGLRGDLVTAENMPFLYGLLDESAYTLSAETIKQSETLPAHTSMLTGLSQEKHGVDWNSMDLTKPYLTVDTVFDYLGEENVSTLTVVSKNKLLYYNHNEMDEDTYFFDEFSEEFANEALDVIQKTNGHDMFIFLHYKDADASGHVSGWGSNEQIKAVKFMDGDLERVYNEVNQRFVNDEITYIFTADHGGLGKGHGGGRPDDLRIPFIVDSNSVDDGLITDEVKIYDATCVILEIFEIEVNSDLDCTVPSGVFL